MTLCFIPLDQLRFGHEADPPINVRKVGRDADLETLAASLNAHGLGQALNVREIDGAFYVADGNRRLAALRMNASKGLLGANAEIRCEQLDNASDELSLALNIERVPMHQADAYEKFAELRDGGLDEADIAQRFGIEERRVKRILSLGRLHPEILEAWRNDELGHNAAETVRAFTLAPSQKAQKEIFDQLSKKGQLAPHWVRSAFGAGNHDASRLLTFVGREAYVQAGGKLVEDLFGDNHAISDPDLVKELTDQRLERELQALIDDGWAWAELADDLPTSWNWNWEKIRREPDTATKDEAAELKKIAKLIGKTEQYAFNDEQRAAAQREAAIDDARRARAFTAEDKARSGVALSVGYDGTLVATRGVLKPSPKKEAAAKKGEPTAAPGISNAVMQRLSVQLTKAVGDAIVANPKTALAAVVAGLAVSGGYGYPISVKAEGLLRETRRVEAFEAVLEALLSKSTDELLAALAHEARFMVDLQVHSSADAPLAKPHRACFVEALEAEALQEALRANFDAEDYFRSVPRALAEAAIREALNEDEARKAAKLKKGPLVDFAVANVPPTGWLPPELRTSTYAGPAAVPIQEAAE